MLMPKQFDTFIWFQELATMSAKVAQLSDQDLYDALTYATYSAPQNVKDMVAEVCVRQHAVFSAVQAAAIASAPVILQQGVTGKMAAQLKLDQPTKFEGETKELANWLFNSSNTEQYVV